MNRHSIPVCKYIRRNVQRLLPWLLMPTLLLFQATSGLQAQANLVKAEYFFDTDPGFGNAIYIGITPGPQIINKSFSANTAELPVGMHQLYIRIQDANGKWSISNRTFMYKSSAPNSVGFPNLVKAEYFYNIDPGFGNGINIPITAGTTLLSKGFTASLDALPVGMHHLYIRTQDANGIWGISSRMIFYKAPILPTSGKAKIIQVEYFIDNDPGFGKGVPLPVMSDTVITAAPIEVNVTGLSNGTHRFFLRLKDERGNWSITDISNFDVSDAISAPFITVTGINRKVFCAGDSLSLGYHATGTYNNDNQFTAWLSNANGSFASEHLIGMVASTSSGVMGCKLPPLIAGGMGYRIRVKSSNPMVVGDTSVTIIIQNPALGEDTTVIHLCAGETTNLHLLYNTDALTAVWNTVNPSLVVEGTYRLIVTNTLGCKDTAFAQVILPKATWTGTVSSNWHDAGNWNNGKVPEASTHVFIQGTTPNICIISQENAYASSVQLKNGGTLQQINGKDLIVDGKCAVLPSP